MVSCSSPPGTACSERQAWLINGSGITTSETRQVGSWRVRMLRETFLVLRRDGSAELPGGVALGLEQLGDCRVFLGQPLLRRGQADLQQPGAQRALPGDERGATRGAGLLAIVVGEERTFCGDATDIGRAIAHLAAVVGADVPVADVIAHDHEDVRLLLLRR